MVLAPEIEGLALKKLAVPHPEPRGMMKGYR